MDYEYILVDQRGRVGTVTFNKPDRLNVFGYEMFGEVRQAIETFNQDPGVLAGAAHRAEAQVASGVGVLGGENLELRGDERAAGLPELGVGGEGGGVRVGHAGDTAPRLRVAPLLRRILRLAA